MKEPKFNVTMNEYLPLRDVVFNTLRQAILRGELKPGERLMEIQLANKLGVSRTPVSYTHLVSIGSNNNRSSLVSYSSPAKQIRSALSFPVSLS